MDPALDLLGRLILEPNRTENELNDVKLTDELQKRLPQIRDIMFNILPVKKFKEIQGVEGKKALRDEIMASVNKLLVTGAVINIYFVEFVVQ